MQGPCAWPINESVLPDTSFWDDLDVVQRMPAIEAATEFLWRWTGRRFGLCPGTIRPCQGRSRRMVPHRVSEPYETAVVRAGSTWLPVVLGDKTLSLGCGSCSTSCKCVSLQGLRLPREVHSVLEVKVDGVVLDQSAWKFHNRTLYRMDGLEWPATQDLLASPDEVGTWEISVEYGTPVPPGGVLAVTLLAEQFARASLGRGGCVLPARVQSIQREGVSVVAYDSLSDDGPGRSGG